MARGGFEPSEYKPAPTPPPADPVTADQLMIVLEQTPAVVAMLTGIKQQFVDSGWSPANAELITIGLFNSSNR